MPDASVVLPETGARFVARSVIPPASGQTLARVRASLRVTSWSPMGAGGDLGKVARARTPPERAGGSPEAVSSPRVSGVPNPATPTGATAKAAERLLRADADARASAPAPSPTSPRPSSSRRARASAPSTSTAADAAELRGIRDSASTRALTKAQIARATVLVHRLANADSSILRDDPTLAPPSRPKLPAASTAADPVKAACVAVRARAAQAFIDALQYNHTSETYFSVDKNRPLHRILDTGRRIARDALPIKCVEATFLALHLTEGWTDVDRVPTAFKTSVVGPDGVPRCHRHIVLLLRDRATGNYGALGISRRKELAFRDVVHPTVSSALTSFRDAYAKLWHAVVKVRVGLPVGHGDAASDAEVCWRHCCVSIRVGEKSHGMTWTEACEAFEAHEASWRVGRSAEKWRRDGERWRWPGRRAGCDAPDAAASASRGQEVASSATERARVSP